MDRNEKLGHLLKYVSTRVGIYGLDPKKSKAIALAMLEQHESPNLKDAFPATGGFVDAFAELLFHEVMASEEHAFLFAPASAEIVQAAQELTGRALEIAKLKSWMGTREFQELEPVKRAQMSDRLAAMEAEGKAS